MLTKPEYGWTDFHIDDTYTYQLSYITDVAIDWLDTAIFGLENGLPFTVSGRCEPGRMLCTVTDEYCYVVFTDEEGETVEEFHSVRLGMVDFCKALYKDISENIDVWVMWAPHQIEHIFCKSFCSLRFRKDCADALDCPLDNSDDNHLKPAKDYVKGIIQGKLDKLKELIDEVDV